jgi:hypothetical protein
MGSRIGHALLIASLVAVVAAVIAGPASAMATTYTFNDVTFTDADGSQITGESEASVKDVRSGTSIYCGYFSDDYRESLGYYFDASPVADPTESEVLDFCLEEFPHRWT